MKDILWIDLDLSTHLLKQREIKVLNWDIEEPLKRTRCMRTGRLLHLTRSWKDIFLFPVLIRSWQVTWPVKALYIICHVLILHNEIEWLIGRIDIPSKSIMLSYSKWRCKVATRAILFWQPHFSSTECLSKFCEPKHQWRNSFLKEMKKFNSMNY